jgi:glycosyltransferase involved in cell wall biosynthesis
MLPQLNPARIPRVLMTADTAGSVWRYALDLAQGLRAYDTATTLCILGPVPSPQQRAAARRIPDLELVCLEAALEWTAESAEDVIDSARQVIAAVRDHRPTVVHLNSPALAAVSGYGVPVVAACHGCLATWWTAVHGRALPSGLRWHHRLVGEGLRRADAVIAPTRAFAASIARTYGLDRPPTVICSGRRPTARANSQKLRIPESRFAFTALCMREPAENLALLEAAAARCPTPLYAAAQFARTGPDSVGLQHVRPAGSLSEGELAEWLAAKPIFVCATLYEPFGLAVLEAAEAACPLVLSDLPGFRELWEGAARFVPTNDPEAVAAAIDSLARDPQGSTLLGAAARRRARRYTAEVMTTKVQAVYGTLLSGRSARAGREVAL